MGDDRWVTIRTLFGAAIELAPKARAAFLDAHLRDQPELRAELDVLLAHNEASGGFAGDLTRDGSPVKIEFDVSEDDGPTPETIGAYRVLGVLGRGGMGVVYRAEQPQARREVAIKVLKSSGASAASLWRLEREAEILARLQHEGIARVVEARSAWIGTGPRPFIAMELVDGLTLDEWCRFAPRPTHARMQRRQGASVCWSAPKRACRAGSAPWERAGVPSPTRPS